MPVSAYEIRINIMRILGRIYRIQRTLEKCVTLKMDALGSFETSRNILMTQRHIPEDVNIQEV
jgi:hypothetical protein